MPNLVPNVNDAVDVNVPISIFKYFNLKSFLEGITLTVRPAILEGAKVLEVCFTISAQGAHVIENNKGNELHLKGDWNDFNSPRNSPYYRNLIFSQALAVYIARTAANNNLHLHDLTHTEPFHGELEHLLHLPVADYAANHVNVHYHFRGAMPETFFENRNLIYTLYLQFCQRIEEFTQLPADTMREYLKKGALDTLGPGYIQQPPAQIVKEGFNPKVHIPMSAKERYLFGECIKKWIVNNKSGNNQMINCDAITMDDVLASALLHFLRGATTHLTIQGVQGVFSLIAKKFKLPLTQERFNFIAKSVLTAASLAIAFNTIEEWTPTITALFLQEVFNRVFPENSMFSKLSAGVGTVVTLGFQLANSKDVMYSAATFVGKAACAVAGMETARCVTQAIKYCIWGNSSSANSAKDKAIEEPVAVSRKRGRRRNDNAHVEQRQQLSARR